jgi:hypothetical protein
MMPSQTGGGRMANGLYPIIRRARRPFIIRDDDSGTAPPPPPVPLIQPETPVSYAKASRSARKGKSASAAASERKG